jgi:class 3 adenylate cyclase
VSEQTQIDFRSSCCWLLLCDIMGSSSLSQRKTGEELAMIVGGWFGRCKEAIEDQGGAINKYLGDGLLAYWPTREDDSNPRVSLHFASCFTTGTCCLAGFLLQARKAWRGRR